LPYREPDRNLPVWGRSSGDMSLIIKPGHYHDQSSGKFESMGYPYGTIPRLLLAWLGTEAVRTKDRQIVLGKSLASFMDAIGITAHTGGKNGSITRVREMMKRLFASDMAIVRGGSPRGTDFATSKFSIAEETCLWWDAQTPDQAGLWQSTVTLSDKFFNEIVSTPVPIDLRALRALRQSPMAIDLYCWLTYRNFSLRSSTTVPWEALKLQFGSGAEAEKKFRETVRRALLQVLEVYPAANVTPTKSGLFLEPSKTSVPRLVKQW
jgi:Plasmid encoded RepA protein